MVDCPHLNNSVCIVQLDLDQLKRLSSKSVFKDEKKFGAGDRASPNSVPTISATQKNNLGLGVHFNDNNWNCVECGTTQCPWLCLSCGLIHCGRYINQDGLKHWKTYPNHSARRYMDVFSSYQCDDFVGNDTNDNRLASVRSSLQFYNRLRCEDHNYSSSKYDNLLEGEDVVEISADDSLPPFYDEGTEEEENEVVEEVEGANAVKFTLSNSNDNEENTEKSVISKSDLIESRSPLSGDEFGKTLLSTESLQAESSTSFQSGLRKRKCENSCEGEQRVKSPYKDATSLSGLDQTPNSFPTSSSEKAETQDRKLRGLRNLGNTCFMNSVLQALGCIEIFRYFMRNLPPIDFYTCTTDTVTSQLPRYNTRNALSSFNEGGVQPTFVSEELRKTLIEISRVPYTLNNAGSTAFGPVAFLEEVRKFAPRFRGFQQHDAHEFLRCILDRMQVELKNYQLPEWLLSEVFEGGSQKSNKSHFQATKDENSYGSEKKCPIAFMFEGTLQSQVTCLSCNTVSNKQDPFLDLSLDIYCSLNSSRTAVIQLSECLERFFAKEELGSDEQYLCTKCCSKQPSTKQLFIKMLPNASVLCLHLKRFRWSSFHRGKLDNMVEFPLKGLDMKPFMTSICQSGNRFESSRGTSDSRSDSISSCSSCNANDDDSKMIYDLTSLVVHHGGGINCGHYTAFGQRNGVWYIFNDSCVKECSADLVTKQKAYILFYTRRSSL
uniref:Ubiquitin carboxyl-terminal hydrolase n=1 Tax=Syphacia muris TaxID=451379 RepID=A0A0N5A999_9BILA